VGECREGRVVLRESTVMAGRPFSITLSLRSELGFDVTTACVGSPGLEYRAVELMRSDLSHTYFQILVLQLSDTLTTKQIDR